MFSRLIFKNTCKHFSNLDKSCKSLVRPFHTTKAKHGSYHLEFSPNAKLNKTILDRFLCLPMPECTCQVMYVWIDGTGEHLRCKTKTLDFIPTSYKDCPNWSFDGSSTYQASGHNSDMYLCPCAMYNDPIRRGNNKLALCEVYDQDYKPAKSNKRASCVKALNKACDAEPMFGMEQEYIFTGVDGRPYGWPPIRGEPKPAGPYYCGVGADKNWCRSIVEAHYRACLYAGIAIYGTNYEVTPAQWEFQIGTVLGIKVADDLWMGRFLIIRIAEEFGVCVTFDPKPLPNWNGSGCHVNMSTKQMRADGGLKVIEEAMKRLEKRHSVHMKLYDPKGGKDNLRRLTGRHETSSVDKFTFAVASRNTSVRVNRAVSEAKKGFFEDRRPASNCDPYSVVDVLTRTVLLGEN